MARARSPNRDNAFLIYKENKGVIFIIVMAGVLLDRLINKGDFMFRNLVFFFYIENEGISLLENGTALGLKVRNKLKDR